MADPRVKVQTQTFYARLHLPRVVELKALAEKHNMSQNMVVNTLIQDAAKRLEK